MNTASSVNVVSVGKIEFPVGLRETKDLTITEWRDDIQSRHPGVESLNVQSWYREYTGYNVYSIRVVMREESDYDQLLRLRAELHNVCI